MCFFEDNIQSKQGRLSSVSKVFKQIMWSKNIIKYSSMGKN